jgi:hypothetical protein
MASWNGPPGSGPPGGGVWAQVFRRQRASSRLRVMVLVGEAASTPRRLPPARQCCGACRSVRLDVFPRRLASSRSETLSPITSYRKDLT